MVLCADSVWNSMSPDGSCSRCWWGRRGVRATPSRESLLLGPILGGHVGVISTGEGHTNPSSCPAASLLPGDPGARWD